MIEYKIKANIAAFAFFVAVLIPCNGICSPFSIYNTEEIITANGERTLLGNGYRLVLGERTIFNGYDITDFIEYIKLNCSYSHPLDILKAIDAKNKEVLNCAHEFQTQRNSKKVINSLFFVAARKANFDAIKYYVGKGADVNFKPIRENVSPLGLNLCNSNKIANYLKSRGAKVLRKESDNLIYMCRKNKDELQFLLTQDIDWNYATGRKPSSVISYMLEQEKVDSDILHIFLKAGSNISSEGFLGALQHGAPSEDVLAILEKNSSLATKPVISRERKLDFFKGDIMVNVETYPLSYILDFDWFMYKSKNCDRDVSCIPFIKNRKLLLEALLNAGAKPKNKKEEKQITKIRTLIRD